MTDFKNVKQGMYSTPFDVRLMLSLFEREMYDGEGAVKIGQTIPDQKIEQHIHSADGIIDAYLIAVYGESALLADTPYFMGPVALEDNESAGSTFAGVIVAITAITEQWLVRFTGTDAFDVSGSVSGAQGSGTVDADFTSTNSDIQILTEDWQLGDNSEITVNNAFLFGTYKSLKIIRTLSAKLAASNLINAYYSLQESEGPTWARQLRKDVMEILKALIDPKSEMSLTAINVEDIGQFEAVAYHIDTKGDDVTPYLDVVDDLNPSEI